ncbi:cell division transport system permease protein [Dysgonomonas sp. PH5-45]|uniref:cell division protein FtsX n=1 Tax=unclassified Dysgonomonas TaxID=2630389 RepID=UPI0024748542|nr:MULTISPECIES: permease-like cell division protein FtsX [unclassified Dysgonomonas]MDH6354891.1 cell division transport system permease protein [Dysgonomonas sp. PH5-45]MDH6387790.1 cell division transport system permease protein [Dysgonomonas sp. PH5-37]
MANNTKTKSTSIFSSGVTTTISITLVLILLGLTILIGFAGKEFISFIKENMSISVQVSDTMDDAAIAKMQKQLEKSPGVKSVLYISKEEIKQQLIEDLGKDPEEVLGYNPASNIFEIRMLSEYANPDSVKVLEKKLLGSKIVNEFMYNESDLQMVNANLSKIGFGLIVLALILMFISFTLIRNTIRLNIYAKRFLINTMQLVGATNSFIRRPFLWRAVLSGFIAAIVANIVIALIVYGATEQYPELLMIIKPESLLIVSLVVIVLGILLTISATAFAVNRYLKMKTNKLYYV